METRRRRLLRFRSLPLRSRLAILTAAAVAVAVAAVAVCAWFITRDQLMKQLDSALTDNAQAGSLFGDRLLGDCGDTAEASTTVADDRPSPYTFQLVYSNGYTCTMTSTAANSGSEKVPYTATPQDVAVASGTQLRTEPHTTTTASGQEMRVITVQVKSDDDDQAEAAGGDGLDQQPDGLNRPQFRGNFETVDGVAVSIARPLSEVTDPLSTLALILLIVSGIGVVGATAAGLWIARAGLRPVDDLTDTVEHIARTEDLSVRIPVDGEDEIARLSTSFNSMTSRLAASRERQQQLIADAGHELRTPLTSLRTNIELLERSEATGRALPPEDRRALLTSVKAQMTELASLIGDLQELSRPDTTPGGGPLQTVAFHEVAENALQRARLRTQDIKILAQLAPWYVRAEPAALERAIVNLLDNAVKFSPSLSTVEVDLHGGELTVRDHGPGIAPEDLPHVFERFWRATASRSLPGSGLGLSIVARTVQQSGGTVGLHPAHGGGTIAVMRLPGTPMAPTMAAGEIGEIIER